MKRLLAVGLVLAAGTPLAAQETGAPDYSRGESWLCRPGRIDACAADQSVTVVEADGAMHAEALVPDADRKFDCFYVYPTVSLDPTPNSDMVAGQEEMRVANVQAARFHQHCRVFAPLYRQVTLTALRDAMLGGSMKADGAMAFADVRAAWESYLAHDNGGRGVVLIGHSQGSRMLKMLLETMPEGERGRVISALVPGTNVERSTLDNTVGEFAWMPACTDAAQAGCVVSYVTFREDVPPPTGSRFGRAQAADHAVLCVNPAALMRHAGSAEAIFPTEGIGTSSKPVAGWAGGQPLPTTNFVAVPGLIETSCLARDGARYLAMIVHPDPADPRVDDVVGDVYVGDRRLDDWGLHLIDMPVVMGDLVALTVPQYEAWVADRAEQ